MADVAGIDLDAQPVGWSRPRWQRLEVTHAPVLDAVDAEVAAHGTIRRSWLRGLSDQPMTLLVASMIWGFGNSQRGPSSVMTMLTSPRGEMPVSEVVDSIVAAAKTGARVGFTSLFDLQGATRVKRLGVAFGSKLVHFAGYDAAPQPRPLVYDMRVWKATQHLADGPGCRPPRATFGPPTTSGPAHGPRRSVRRTGWNRRWWSTCCSDRPERSELLDDSGSDPLAGCVQPARSPPCPVPDLGPTGAAQA